MNLLESIPSGSAGNAGHKQEKTLMLTFGSLIILCSETISKTYSKGFSSMLYCLLTLSVSTLKIKITMMAMHKYIFFLQSSIHFLLCAFIISSFKAFFFPVCEHLIII